MKAYKYLAVLSLFALLPSCGGEKKKLFMPDSTRWTDQDVPLTQLDTISVNTDSLNLADDMRKLFPYSDSLIEGRPVSFYLNRRDISQTARDFYLLRFIPSSRPPYDIITSSLADSLLTKNDTTRPFYYFLFLRLHKIAPDAGIEPDIEQYGKAYAMNFPEEFYRKLSLPIYRATYSKWVNDVAQSASTVTPEEYRQSIISEQMKHAKKMTPELQKKIHDFADSVYNRVDK